MLYKRYRMENYGVKKMSIRAYQLIIKLQTEALNTVHLPV
jgi:hypothetical protein